VVEEWLTVSQDVQPRVETDPASRNRYLRVNALAGPLKLAYDATVDLAHHVSEPTQIGEVPVARLPEPVLSYLYPSRYCRSDRLHKLAMREFGQQWQGYSRVQAISDWVLQRTTFSSNTSNSNTSAIDTLLETVGVCRDFAHLMIALCRAINIPARFTTGIDYGADPALGTPDFHACVEPISATAGTCSTRPAPRFRWASCDWAPDAMPRTSRSRPSSARSRRRRRASPSRPSPVRTGASSRLGIAPRRCPPTVRGNRAAIDGESAGCAVAQTAARGAATLKS